MKFLLIALFLVACDSRPIHDPIVVSVEPKVMPVAGNYGKYAVVESDRYKSFYLVDTSSGETWYYDCWHEDIHCTVYKVELR